MRQFIKFQTQLFPAQFPIPLAPFFLPKSAATPSIGDRHDVAEGRPTKPLRVFNFLETPLFLFIFVARSSKKVCRRALASASWLLSISGWDVVFSPVPFCDVLWNSAAGVEVEVWKTHFISSLYKIKRCFKPKIL